MKISTQKRSVNIEKHLSIINSLKNEKNDLKKKLELSEKKKIAIDEKQRDIATKLIETDEVFKIIEKTSKWSSNHFDFLKDMRKFQGDAFKVMKYSDMKTRQDRIKDFISFFSTIGLEAEKRKTETMKKKSWFLRFNEKVFIEWMLK